MSISFGDDNNSPKNIEPLINDLVEHLRLFFSISPQILERDKPERVQIAQRVELEETKIELIIEKINNAWPEGNSLYQELMAMRKILHNVIQNALEWADFIDSAEFSISKPEIQEKNKDYVQNNRKLSANSDAHLFKADEILKKSFGIDLMEKFGK